MTSADSVIARVRVLVSEKRRSMVSGRSALMVIGILLIGANLRAPFTGVPPILSFIQEDLGLNALQAGALTALPLIAFATVSPLASLLTLRLGLERALLAGMLAILAGIVCRSAPLATCLYLGTALIGAGIAVGNVLLPSLIKREFPARVAPITAAYVVTMGATGAVVSATSIPLMRALGGQWATGLTVVAVLPIAALFLWLPHVKRKQPLELEKRAVALTDGRRIWRSALAWQVTLFMGLNSFLFYVMIAWIPSILVADGYTAAEAGTLHGVLQLATGVPGLFLGAIIQRLRDQKALATVISLTTLLGLVGLVFFPAAAMLSVSMLGLGIGSAVLLSLVFMGLRTPSAHSAAVLSGMAQSVGYTFAALGSLCIGTLHDMFQSWAAPLFLCMALALVMAVSGYLAGRSVQIQIAG